MKFFESVAYPLLVIVLTPLFAVAGSKLQTGAPLEWAKKVPLWVYATFIALMALWLCASLIVRRISRLRNENLPRLPSVIAVPSYGYRPIAELNHADVTWVVQAPAPAPWQELNRNNVDPHSLEVAMPPHCPSCRTELEETKNFWGSFKWSCIRCSFSKKNDLSYLRESIRAKMLAKSHWIEGRENHQ